MLLVALVCLSVGEQYYSKSCKRIVMKFMETLGVVQGRTDYILMTILVLLDE